MKSSANPSAPVKLNNGVLLPRVGLGVYQAANGGETRAAVRDALELGYRHVDTASAYRNESDVGEAVRASGLPRQEVFVTTKVWNADQGFDETLRAFDGSLKKLGLGYVDLYLVHWPLPGKRLDTWRAFERIYREGRAKAIGVSNFMPRHLAELMAHATVPPAVNQIEVTPFLQQRDTRAACAKHGIAVEAYSPLTRGQKFSHPVVADIATKVKRSPAQVLLRWGGQHGLVVLPKSTHRERIAANLALFDFELPAEDMARLDGLEEGLVTGWDPRALE